MSQTYDVAVVGPPGAALETLLELLAEREFPVGRLHAIGADSAAGRRVQWRGRHLSIADVDGFDFSAVQIVWFVGDGALCLRHADTASAAGAIVIDCTSVLSRRDNVACVVPEINAQAIAEWRTTRQLSQPEAAAIHLAVALAPVERSFGLARVHVATYHAVSAEGEQGAGRLADQTARLLNARSLDASGKQIAFNVLPQVGAFDADGHSDVERALVSQTRAVLATPDLPLSVTAAQVPVFFGHSQAVHIETRDAASPAEIRALLGASSAIEVVDLPADHDYATAVTDAAAQDAVFISRVRADISNARGINFWIVADDVRKGGVLNGIQIAERLTTDYMS